MSPREVCSGGEALVTTGAGKTVMCISCHGPGLKGLLDVPRIAGRSPSYLMRQVYDMKTGTRTANNTALMQPVLAAVNIDDMLAIVAYLASERP